MTEFANHEHLSHHHRNTLETLFVHPTSGNLKWVDVLSLLAAVGSVEDKSGGDVRVVLGSKCSTSITTRTSPSSRSPIFAGCSGMQVL